MGLVFLMLTVFYLTLLRYESFGYPAGSQGAVKILKPFGGTLDTLENFITNIANSKTISPSFPDSGRTHAILEIKSKESIPIQLDDKYGSLQEFVAGIFKPHPIVDTAEEYEKYGNDAATSRKVSNLIIGGFEGLSNLLNAGAETPFVSAKQFGKKITASLNTVGGRLVGLS